MNDKVTNLSRDLKLVYQEPEKFSTYYSIYHGQKYGNYYFRKAPATLKEKAELLDIGYFIKKGNVIIGGLFIKPNFMADLFVVTPYEDYEGLTDVVLDYLIDISDPGEKIFIQEVLEPFVPIYRNKGFKVSEEGYWMIRPTAPMDAKLPDGYAARSVRKEDISEVAELIMDAYQNNIAFQTIDTKENYEKHVENFLKDDVKNEVIFNSSKVVIYSNEIVGSILSKMEH